MQIGVNALLGYGGAIVLAGVAALTSNHPLLQAAIAAAAAGCGFAGVRAHIASIREEQRIRVETEAEKNEQFLLQTVNRMRHDVLNDLQVLFGYIQLKKYDNLLPTMENIKAKLALESYISRLGIPSLVVFLLTARSNVPEFELEVELEEELNLAKLPVDPKAVFAATRDMIGLFQKAADTDGQNVLSLQFAVEEDALLLDFMYRGRYDRETLEPSVGDLLTGAGEGVALSEMMLDDEEAAITLMMPLRA